MKVWDVLPAKDLTIQSNWQKNGDRYSAVRTRLLIVRRELDDYRDGVVKESHSVHLDSIEIETSRQTVIVQTDTLTAGLRFAVSRRMLDQLSSKISSELAIKVPGYSGKPLRPRQGRALSEGLVSLFVRVSAHDL